MHTEWIDQLSAYLDDELDLAARRRLEAHLAQCPACAAVYRDLGEIVRTAPEYRGEDPARDLWPGIAAGIEASRVVELRPAPAVRAARRWMPLAIAAAGVAAVGLGGALWYRGYEQGRATARVVVAERPVPSAVQPAAASAVMASPSYSAAVADLERSLEANRSRLDTATVRIVEENLRTIDRAIAESQAAIQRDPANAYLNDQIAANMRRKLALLRLAARAASKET
jgi:anti-sigma factor RsiW